jgi:DNA ligase-1
MAEGHEGLMLRHPDATYKFGRSTVRQQGLLKVKAFEDDEALVVGFEELYRNLNEAFTSETGYTKRSTHQENKVPGNTMGALIVQSPKWNSTFNIGTGFSADDRQKIWDNRGAFQNKFVKFKYLKAGMKDVPRHPVFLSWRDPIDM